MFGEPLEVGPSRVKWLQSLDRVDQDAQIVVEQRCTRVGAHQAEDRVGLPPQLGKASPHAGGEAIVGPGEQEDQAMVLIEAVIWLAVEIEHALHALLVLADTLAFEWVAAEALGN